MTSDIMTAVKFLAAEAPQRHHIYGVPFFGTCEEVRCILIEVGPEILDYETDAAMVVMVNGRDDPVLWRAAAHDHAVSLTALRRKVSSVINEIAPSSATMPAAAPAATP